jgi:hypothetical protein
LLILSPVSTGLVEMSKIFGNFDRFYRRVDLNDITFRHAAGKKRTKRRDSLTSGRTVQRAAAAAPKAELETRKILGQFIAARAALAELKQAAGSSGRNPEVLK